MPFLACQPAGLPDGCIRARPGDKLRAVWQGDSLRPLILTHFPGSIIVSSPSSKDQPSHQKSLGMEETSKALVCVLVQFYSKPKFHLLMWLSHRESLKFFFLRPDFRDRPGVPGRELEEESGAHPRPVRASRSPQKRLPVQSVALRSGETMTFGSLMQPVNGMAFLGGRESGTGRVFSHRSIDASPTSAVP